METSYSTNPEILPIIRSTGVEPREPIGYFVDILEAWDQAGRDDAAKQASQSAQWVCLLCSRLARCCNVLFGVKRVSNPFHSGGDVFSSL